MKSLLNKLLAFFFCIYVILAAYPGTGVLSLGDIIMISLVFFTFLSYQTLVYYNELKLFSIYVILQTLLIILLNRPYISQVGAFNRLLAMVLLYFVASYVSMYADRSAFLKIYTIVSIICMAGIVFQFAQVWIFHTGKTILIPFYSLASKDETLLLSSIRPTSFFLEPQHFASFILPLLVIELRRQNIIFSAIITLCIFLCTSTQGIVLAGIVWIIYFVAFRDIRKWAKMLAVVVIIVFALLGTQTDLFITTIEKAGNYTFSDSMRLFRAFEIYKDMPIMDKITGIGTKIVNNYISVTGVASIWYRNPLTESRNFISSFFGNFVEFGFIGGILYLAMLVTMFKNGRTTGKTVVIIIILSSLSMTITYNVWFVFYFCMYQFLKDESYLNILEGNRKLIRVKSKSSSMPI